MATRQAMDDFREGHLVLYTLSSESEKPQYTGKHDGPFEIWTYPFSPDLGRAHRYSKEQFVDFYNRKMRYVHSHADKFQRKPRNPQGESE